MINSVMMLAAEVLRGIAIGNRATNLLSTVRLGHGAFNVHMLSHAISMGSRKLVLSVMREQLLLATKHIIEDEAEAAVKTTQISQMDMTLLGMRFDTSLGMCDRISL